MCQRSSSPAKRGLREADHGALQMLQNLVLMPCKRWTWAPSRCGKWASGARHMRGILLKGVSRGLMPCQQLALLSFHM